MIRRLLFLLPVIIVAILMAAFWLGLDPNRDPRAFSSALIGKPVPAVDLPSLTEGAPRLNLGAFKGQLVAVNFFASWCLPCRAEHPQIKRLGPEFGVPVIGIAWKDKPAQSRAFLEELGDPYVATGADENGRTGIDFGITGIPETFLVDGAGIVRYRFGGPLTPEALINDMAPAIAEAKK